MAVSGTNRDEQTLPDRNDRRLELGSTTDMMEVFDGAFERGPGIRRSLVTEGSFEVRRGELHVRMEHVLGDDNAN